MLSLRNALGSLVLMLMLFGAHPILAQELRSGPQILTFFSTVDDRDQPYAIYLPNNFDDSRTYPLVISLHGAGSNHRLNLRRVFGKSNAGDENDVEASRYFPEWDDVEYIVASPYARGTMGYQGVAEKDVYDVVADVKERFRIDGDRVFLTGLSRGGGGTLWLGLTRPDIWAAIAPVCPAPPDGTKALAGNALNIPVHIFHGAADPVVNPDSVREWVDHFESLETQIEYTEYPGVGHNSWENAYADGQIFEWFDQFSRDSHPDRVRFTSDRYEYDTAYWIRFDGLTPGTHARIDARVESPDRIDITTSELDGFTLQLADHPEIRKGNNITVTVDGRELQIEASDSVSFSRRDDGWAVGQTTVTPSAKRPGAEGPMGEAVADRHIYVYGTADGPAEATAAARQEQAVTAATWSVYRGPFLGRVMVFPRVIADEHIRPSDYETSNLVLFGNRETNRVIAQFEDRLPLHLDASAEEYGLAYIYPIDGRYVLISSGLPWWEFEADDGQGPFSNQVPALDLMSMPDYVLFRGGEIVAQGRFDSEWQLAEQDAAAIAATNVVAVDQVPRGSK